MVLVVAFVVLEILENLICKQKRLPANNGWRRQNYEECSSWPNLYFDWTIRKCYQFYAIIFISRDKNCC